jgi:hypothetical protein
MDDAKADKIIQLLEEMKSLQQQSVENYRVAMARQEEAIALQKKTVRPFRRIIVPLVLFALVLVVIAILVVLSLLMKVYR